MTFTNSSSKQQEDCRVPMALVNYFAKYQVLPWNHRTLISKAEKWRRKDAANTDSKDMVEVPYRIGADQEVMKRHLPILNDIENVNLCEWVNTVRSGLAVCQFEDQKAFRIFQTCISPEILNEIVEGDTVDEIIENLKSYKYSETYITNLENRLMTIDQDQFYTIKEYFTKIRDWVKEIGFIKNKLNSEVFRMIDSYFFQNLATTKRLELRRLQIKTANDAKIYIQQDEELILSDFQRGKVKLYARQEKSNFLGFKQNSSSQHQKKRFYDGKIKDSGNVSGQSRYSSNNNQQFSGQNQEENKDMKRFKKDNNNSKSYSFKEQKPGIKELLIPCAINSVKAKALLDTGSQLSLITAEFAKTAGLTTHQVDERTVETANKGVVTITEQVEAEVTFDNVPHNTFKLKFWVIPKSGVEVILGTEFFREFDVDVNFGTATIKISDVEFEMDTEDSGPSVSDPDLKIIEKSKIYGLNKGFFQFTNLPKSMRQFLLTIQQQNLSLGLIPNVVHHISLKEKRVVTSKGYRVPER